MLTEAEREYAARAGTTTAFSFGNNINPTQANYDARLSYAGSVTGVANGKTMPVCSYSPNSFGRCDMHGNVWEWVEDRWNGTYNGAPADGSAWTSGECVRRVLRGGSWRLYPQRLRSADRDGIPSEYTNFSLGFRVARTD